MVGTKNRVGQVSGNKQVFYGLRITFVLIKTKVPKCTSIKICQRIMRLRSGQAKSGRTDASTNTEPKMWRLCPANRKRARQNMQSTHLLIEIYSYKKAFCYFVIYLLILQVAPTQSAVHWHENALSSGVHVPPFSHVTVRHSFTVAKMCTYKQYLFGKTLCYYYIAIFQFKQSYKQSKISIFL